MRARESGVTAGGMPAAEISAPAARQCERRNEDGTGKRRRNSGTPNMAGHGLISLRSMLVAPSTISVQIRCKMTRTKIACCNAQRQNARAMLRRNAKCCVTS
jgi:hypothetical protein